MPSTVRLSAAVSAAVSSLLLAACAGQPMAVAPAFDQASLPAAVQVPAGHTVAMETVGAGLITYECKANASGAHEWVFIGPDATLSDRRGRTVGRYYGPPATWELQDGSKLTATQVAVAPAGAGNIPLQLVKANPATGMGRLNGATYIQRVATRGGVAPAAACAAANAGARQTVAYQADYIVWKAA